MDSAVLVGVLKNRRDLQILLTEHWYRIPARHIPRRKFDFIAFYQPIVFGRKGKRIRLYARAKGYRTIRRDALLPSEPAHERARANYVRIDVGAIQKLPWAIKNTSPRRISFGFTTLPRLLTARNILELYGVAETEQMLAKELQRANIKAIAQHYVMDNRTPSFAKAMEGSPLHNPRVNSGTLTKRRKRYRLDFAVFCKRGKIALECDNVKAHSGARHKAKDRAKDVFLKSHGWTVMRFGEKDIVANAKQLIRKIKSVIRKLGG